MRVPGIERDPERGRRIRRLREHGVRLSQQQVADKVGVSLWTIGKWEQGGPMHRPNLRALAEELKTTEDYLLTGKEPALSGEIGGDDPRFDQVDTRISRLDTKISDRLDGLERALESLARAVEDLALREPLPGQEDPPQHETGEPRQQT